MSTLTRALLIGHDYVFAVPEFVGPYGIADFLVVGTVAGVLESRLAANVPPLLNELDAAIVSTVNPKRGKTVPEVASQLRVIEHEVDGRMTQLLRWGALDRTASGRWIRHPCLVPLGKLHALECKVADWRKALDQARTYALWADTASAVLAYLPEEEGRIKRLATESKSGLAVTSDWLVKPRIRGHRQMRRLWSSEHLVAALTG